MNKHWNEDGYQGEESLFNKAYYGKSTSFFRSESQKLLQSDKKRTGELLTALGMIELNDDYT
ncbi:hypothetical protein [Streptomyces griseorubiginosus]